MSANLERRQYRAFGAKTAVLSLIIALANFAFSPRGRAASTPDSADTQPASRSFDFSYVVTVTPPGGPSKARVWVPLPSTDQYQTISQLQLKGPSNIRIHKDARYGNRYAFFTVDPLRVTAPFEIRLTFHVVRYDRRAELTQDARPSDSLPKDVAPFLQPDKLSPTDDVVAKLASEQIEGLTDPLQKARKIYEYAISAMHHDSHGAACGRAETALSCDSRGDRGADFPSLFISMARAAGIPARFNIGFLLPKEQKGGAILDYHSWAEFYVSGLGWIPLDASEAPQEPNMRDHYFGTIDADRVTFSLGRDIPVTPAPKAGPLNYVVYPCIEVDGKAYSEYSAGFFFHDTGIPSAPLGKKQIYANGRLASYGKLHFAS